MWTHVSINVTPVWEDALYRLVALWVDDDGSEPVVIEKGGRVALGPDDSPEGILRSVAGALLRDRPSEARRPRPS